MSRPVLAGQILTDTLTGLTPGHTIGGRYAFKNGNPSIPIAQDTVDANGQVSFIKPGAPFDSIEYFDFTAGKPILALLNPINVPINNTLSPGMEFPILGRSPSSFFDVFVELSLPEFTVHNLAVPGTFSVGQSLSFTNGTSPGVDGVSIGNFTGAAFVLGFDTVSVVPAPEPTSLGLFGVGAAGVGVYGWRRRRSTSIA
jgi:hypothetical protein